MDSEKKEINPFVELIFGPNWDYLSTVRSFIVNFLAISLSDKKRADLIAMAVNELVENAIKYSDRDGIEIKILVENMEPLALTVHVRNHTTEKEAHNLLRILDDIHSKTPLEAFMTQMKESALNKEGYSRIGLARIRYEAKARLNATYNGSYVNVHAEFTDEVFPNE